MTNALNLLETLQVGRINDQLSFGGAQNVFKKYALSDCYEASATIWFADSQI